MTTIILVKTVEQEPSVRETLGSVVEDGETVHFIRLPSVRCLGPLIQAVNPMVSYGVDYTIRSLPKDYDVAELIDFAIESGADRICIGIDDRTVSGKARIDDLTQSILLHDAISGDVVVGDRTIILENLSYDT
jgi:hypothetical protein